jgi:pyroglutamyl-peptidase
MRSSRYMALKHVEIGTGYMSVTVLVTGFGAFPGAAKNPTAALIDKLAAHKARLRRLDIKLELHVLPVVYADIGPKLQCLVDEIEPDIILHFGLAARRKSINVETRAVNRIGMLHPDALGARCMEGTVIAGKPHILRATFPVSHLTAALRRDGIANRVSINAGDYICNQTLYLSLSRAHAHMAGFIHVPKIHLQRAPNLTTLVRTALTAILICARIARHRSAHHKDLLYLPS